MAVSKRIIALFMSLAILSSAALPAFAAGGVEDTGIVLYDFWNGLSYSYWDSLGLGGIYAAYTNWCTEPYRSSKAQYGVGGGSGRSGVRSGASTENIYNNPDSTQRHQILNTTNNTWYNPITNNYTTYNNITYNNEYNVFNITNNQYNTYITNNYTYISYYIVDTTTESTWYYEIYYQLPDGRNTYDLKAEDIWGLGLSYDAVNYNSVAEDDGTLGLWHFDGNLQDASVHGVHAQYIGNAVYTFIDSGFASALSWGTSLYQLNFPIDPISSSTAWTLEGRMYVSGNAAAPGQGVVKTSSHYLTSFWSSSVGTITASAFDGFTPVGSPSVSFSQTEYTRVLEGTDSSCSKTMEYYASGPAITLNLGGPISTGDCTYTAESTVTISYVRPPSQGVLVKVTEEVTYKLYSVSSSGASVPLGEWFTFAFQNSSNGYQFFLNGVVQETWACKGLDALVLTNGTDAGCVSLAIDELRLTNRALYSGNYTPSSQPFDTNKVLVLPDSGEENQIAVKSTVPVTSMRVGGVRPTYPENGYLYVFLQDGVVVDVQQYQTDGWYSVAAAIYRNGEWVTLLGQDLSDIVIEKPEESPDPSPSPPPGDNTPGGSGGSSQTENALSKVLDTLLSGILSVVGSILGLLVDLFFGLFGWVVRFLAYVNAEYLGGFFPAPVWAIISVALPLIVVLGIVRFIRGFF